MEQTVVITKEKVEQTIEAIGNLNVFDDEPISWVDEHPVQAAAFIEICLLISGTVETALAGYLKRNNLTRVEFNLGTFPDCERMAFGHEAGGEPKLFQVA